MNLIKPFYLLLLWIMPKSKKKTAKVIYLMSFPANDGQIIEKLAQRYANEFVLFFTEQAREYAEGLAIQGVNIRFYGEKQLLFNNAISYLKQAQVILVDNYYPELSVLPKEAGKKVIQLWHAIGAIKKFGWEDAANYERSQMDQRRFQKVYDTFTDIVVGSEAMGQVFQNSYHVSSEVIRHWGIPKTDLLKQQSMGAGSEKIILYAPTYRESATAMLQVIQAALEAFAAFPNRHFQLKLHPTFNNKELKLPENVTLTALPLDQLFGKTDLFITDYSASVFEFMMNRTNGKIIFFIPDVEQYKQRPGIHETFIETAPGPIAGSTQALLQVLTEETFSLYGDKYAQWNEQWNQYNDGKAGERVLALVEAGLG